jgi:hypothetical protein
MSFLKWLGGIVAGVIIFSISLYLTDFFSEPNLKITNFEPGNVYVGQRSEGNFTVYNEGKATAERCRINWTFSDGRSTFSDEFGLPPKEKVKVNVPVLIQEDEGTFQSYAKVEYYFKNKSFSTDSVYKPISVSNKGNEYTGVTNLSPDDHDKRLAALLARASKNTTT